MSYPAGNLMDWKKRQIYFDFFRAPITEASVTVPLSDLPMALDGFFDLLWVQGDVICQFEGDIKADLLAHGIALDFHRSNKEFVGHKIT